MGHGLTLHEFNACQEGAPWAEEDVVHPSQEDGPGSEPEVDGKLVKKRDGEPAVRRANLVRILSEDSRWKGRIRFNAFTDEVTVDDQSVDDNIEASTALWIERAYELAAPSKAVGEAIRLVGHEAEQFHPVRAWLDSLEWDGIERLPGIFPRYFGAPETELVIAMGMRWLVGGVARVMDPGCKLDTMVVLMGEQGQYKSQGCRALMPDPRWFADTPFDLNSKDAYLVIRGIWLYEIAELESFEKAGVEKLKSFLSSSYDVVRRPYERYSVRIARQVFFVGTTNKRGFLKDATGSRRIWPVPTNRLDLVGIARDREQLWAEALVRYKRKEPWWLPVREERRLVEASRPFTAPETWEDIVADWVTARTTPFTTAEVLVGALGLAPEKKTGRFHRAHENRLGKVLRGLGYRKEQVREGESRVYRWVLPPEEGG